jgi:predicted nucleic acid-binding protein
VSGMIFVDASAWMALAITRDRHHRAARGAYPGLLRDHRVLVTTNLVVAETHILLRRLGSHNAAMRFLESIRESHRIEKVYSDPQLEEEAEEILRRYAGQDFSLADAVSFALMRRRGIQEAFTFDRHFTVAGFTCVPQAGAGRDTQGLEIPG